jgi:hypothetical protein
MSILEVPVARLHHETRGSAPLMLLAPAVAGDRAVTGAALSPAADTGQ